MPWIVRPVSFAASTLPSTRATMARPFQLCSACNITPPSEACTGNGMEGGRSFAFHEPSRLALNKAARSVRPMAWPPGR